MKFMLMLIMDTNTNSMLELAQDWKELSLYLRSDKHSSTQVFLTAMIATIFIRELLLGDLSNIFIINYKSYDI